MSETQETLSKFLSLVLRHEPETIGVHLDEGGWVGIDELLTALARSFDDALGWALRTVQRPQDQLSHSNLAMSTARRFR
jgi:putative RNA 2'-phosphotransferase